MVQHATFLLTPLTVYFLDMLLPYNKEIVALLVMGYIAKEIQHLVYSFLCCAEISF